ncbi:TorD/DmsD family molecular chaperone [Albidovulum sp.]
MTGNAAAVTIAEEDRARADLYDFLAAILARPPEAALLERIAALQGDATPIGAAIGTLAGLAARTRPAAAEAEFNALFVGIGRGELVPYASYYLTGFLNEKPLAQLRRDMERHRISRVRGVHEPEDGIASLMEMMAGLIDGRFAGPAGLEAQRTFFNRHIAPWAAHFFADLEGAQASVLYAAVGTLGRTFMEVETEAFRLAGG